MEMKIPAEHELSNPKGIESGEDFLARIAWIFTDDSKSPSKAEIRCGAKLADASTADHHWAAEIV